MFCTKCGKENPNGAKFCKYCGAPLKSPQTSGSSGSPELTETEQKVVDGVNKAIHSTSKVVSGIQQQVTRKGFLQQMIADVETQSINLISILGGVLCLLGLFLPFIKIDIPFWGLTVSPSLISMSSEEELGIGTWPLIGALIIAASAVVYLIFMLRRKGLGALVSLLVLVLATITVLGLFHAVLSSESEAKYFIKYGIGHILLIVSIFVNALSIFLWNLIPEDHTLKKMAREIKLFQK